MSYYNAALETYNYYNDSRVQAGLKGKWYKEFDPQRMVVKINLFVEPETDDDPDEMEEVEDIPKTQPSQAIAFSEPVEGVNSEDPEDLADSTSESFGLSFIADEDAMPSDYEEFGECGFDHGYEPFEAQMAHAEIQELNFDD